MKNTILYAEILINAFSAENVSGCARNVCRLERREICLRKTQQLSQPMMNHWRIEAASAAACASVFALQVPWKARGNTRLLTGRQKKPKQPAPIVAWVAK